MDDDRLRQIMILGNGATAWLVAAALGRFLRGHQVEICVVGDESVARRLETTSPATNAFHRRIGIDESDLLREVRGGYSLGTRYLGWAEPGDDYMQTMGPAGPMLHGVEFHHFVNRLRRGGNRMSFDDFAIAAHAARLGRFAGPRTSGGDDIPSLAYGLQLDSARYRDYLANRAKACGVKSMAGSVKTVEQAPDTGKIERIHLQGGRVLPVDFVFDCGAETSVLMRDSFGIGFDDWTHWFPCDCQAVSLAPDMGETPVYASLTRTATGWIKRTSAPRTRGCQFYHASAAVSEDDAMLAVTKAAGEESGHAEIRPLPRRGSLREFWRANCVALGDAAGYSNDFLVTGLHLAQSGVLRWLELYPDRHCDPLIASEYNRAALKEMQRVRDVHVLHMALARRDSAFWREASAAAIPGTLQYKLEVFKVAGVLPAYEFESVSRDVWISLLIGMGVWPGRHDPLADNHALVDIEAELTELRAAAGRKARTMPDHDAVLAGIGQRSTLSDMVGGAG